MSLEGTVTTGYNLSENEEFQYHLTLSEATSQQFIAGVLEKTENRANSTSQETENV